MNKKFRKAIARSVAGVLAALSNVGSASAVFDVSKTIANFERKYVTVTELLNSAEIMDDTLGNRLLLLQEKLKQNFGEGKVCRLSLDYDAKLPGVPRLSYLLAPVGAQLVRQNDLAHERRGIGIFSWNADVPVCFYSRELAEFVAYCCESDNLLTGFVNLNKGIQQVILHAKDVAKEVTDWDSISESKDYWLKFLWHLRDQHTNVFNNFFGEYCKKEKPEVANPEVAGPEGGKPEVAGPEGGKPEVAGPEGGKPEVAGPEGGNPVVAGPEVANPEVAGPVGGNPEVAGPEVANPVVAGPVGAPVKGQGLSTIQKSTAGVGGLLLTGIMGKILFDEFSDDVESDASTKADTDYEDEDFLTD